MEIGSEQEDENLVIEVELTMTSASADSPNALEVLLFEKELPSNGEYAASVFASRGSSGIWSVAVSAHDLKAETYFVVVKGVDVNQVRFRVVALLIESELALGHRHHGEICEGTLWPPFGAL
jgi:hypothetical protein